MHYSPKISIPTSDLARVDLLNIDSDFHGQKWKIQPHCQCEPKSKRTV